MTGAAGNFIWLVMISGLYQRKNNALTMVANNINSKVLNIEIKILLDLFRNDDLFLFIVISFVKNFLLFYYDG